LLFARSCIFFTLLQIKRALRGLKVRLSHGAGTRSCKVTGVSKEPLKDLT
jgi:hypothetical protein